MSPFLPFGLTNLVGNVWEVGGCPSVFRSLRLNGRFVADYLSSIVLNTTRYSPLILGLFDNDNEAPLLIILFHLSVHPTLSAEFNMAPPAFYSWRTELSHGNSVSSLPALSFLDFDRIFPHSCCVFDSNLARAILFTTRLSPLSFISNYPTI